MTDRRAILAIDQGTTSSRALVFDMAGNTVALAQTDLTQHYPGDGWVEHDPEQIWRDTLAACRSVLTQAAEKGFGTVCIGITNQRETTIVWDRRTGDPIHNAIVWQDRRTAPLCRTLRDAGHETMVAERTGLLLDPYFSGTKIAWLLDNVPGARDRAERGELAFGTVDSFLLWRLTGGRHATDATNASRTLLFNIHTQDWDDDLLALLGIPRSLLPEVTDCAGPLGETSLFGDLLPVTGMAGDQQAATVGQACLKPGMLKSTYGTGCFALLNTGHTPIASRNRLLTTVAYRLDGVPTYALEGSIFIAGAAIQWLRDGLGIIGTSSESAALAQSLPDNEGVYMVPAFTGLGAPWWDPDARGLITGLTRNTGPAHLARAALEAACYQTDDLLRAMRADYQGDVAEIRVDGGMAANDWLLQFLSDITDAPVERPHTTEITALGAALLAGLGHGLWESPDEAALLWQRAARFAPAMSAGERKRLVDGWTQAVRRSVSDFGQEPMS
ncbi:glycerol kinase GlpK [Iodidimonas sp. SYSU 1G8]|uniref:glycerol kinase GlpK n=1 Tax=Iodidimonas sp. SYSU 1G8 TaxID=3133967 RepID=UPI0031FE6B8D